MDVVTQGWNEVDPGEESTGFFVRKHASRIQYLGMTELLFMGEILGGDGWRPSVFGVPQARRNHRIILLLTEITGGGETSMNSFCSEDEKILLKRMLSKSPNIRRVSVEYGYIWERFLELVIISTGSLLP